MPASHLRMFSLNIVKVFVFLIQIIKVFYISCRKNNCRLKNTGEKKMINTPAINNPKINSGINQLQTNGSGQKGNPFVQEAITNLFDFIDVSTSSEFSWHENMQQQMNSIETQTKTYKEALATPYGNALNINT
jgi:hypothetical protein